MAEYGKVGTPLNPTRKKAHAVLRKRVFIRDSFTCQNCGIQAQEVPEDYSGGLTVYTEDRIEFQVDHIKPRCRGGENSISNLRCLCQPCNSKKGGRL